MANDQVIMTTVFGPQAETIEKTFASFLKVANTELHVFVYNPELPRHRHPQLHYHLVKPDPDFTSVRRDALFRRWTLPDQLGFEYALVVDGTDALCLQPLPPFREMLRGGSVAAAAEWIPPVRILGQGFTSAYLNAGVTFWHLPSSREFRQEIERRGRACYRGPFDDQTTINEVVYTKYPDRLTILPPQYNWRAMYRKNVRAWQNWFRAWPRVDSLDGVRIYHNHHCLHEVMEAAAMHSPAPMARLPDLPTDRKPLTPSLMLWRRLKNRWLYS